MKIAVCVKQVPEAQAKRIDPSTKRLDRSGEAALNAFDANAIEEALRVKDASGDGEVVLVSLGPERALDALRKGLAMGADRAVLVNDESAAGSDAINEPRYPSLKGIMGAKKKPQETLAASDLGVDAAQLGEAGSKTEVRAVGDPPPRGDTVKIDDDGSGAQKIVDFLAEKRF